LELIGAHSLLDLAVGVKAAALVFKSLALQLISFFDAAVGVKAAALVFKWLSLLNAAVGVKAAALDLNALPALTEKTF
jgi:hypothetical protein